MAQSFNTNLFNVAKHYVGLLNLEVTKTTLKQCLEENPLLSQPVLPEQCV